MKCTKAATASSHFYRVFLFLSSPRASKQGKKGTLESLTQVIVAGFGQNREVASLLDRDVADGGLLLLTANEKKSVQTSMKNLNCTEITKFHHILAYQIELGYDLAISPDNNVSMSPGFEAVLGITSSD